MKRFLKITAVFITLMLIFSACIKDEAEYIPEKIGGTVSFSAGDYQYKGDFVFKKEGESYFTVLEPKEIRGCTVKYSDGNVIMIYDGVSAEITEHAKICVLFSVVEDFAKGTHVIPKKGIKSIKGGVNEREYTVEFNCEKKFIESITFDGTEYSFLKK